MKAWSELTHYASLDWAKDHHMVVVVNAQGKIVADFEFAHSLEGWRSFTEKLSAWPNLAVTIETCQGAAVDQLLQRGYIVYPVHPVAAKSYRERKAPSGTKTDHLDAWGLADALRLDGQDWKALQPMDPLTQRLRLLCRDEVALIEQRTTLVNQLQQALSEYYPAALEAFDDWTDAFTWEFVVEFPTPQALVKAGQRRWEKFLHTHKLWRPATVETRLKLFSQADQFKASEPIVLAKSQLAVSLAKLLRTLAQQLALYRQQIETLFENHPDHDLFGRLPGAKKILDPRLLAGVGSDPKRYGSHEVLQGISERGAWHDWLEYFLLGVARMSEDALSRASRMNAKLAEWQKQVAGESSNAPLRMVEMLASNPFITARGASEKLAVAFTTAQRAIERLERSGIVKPVSEAKRNRVYCAQALLDIIEEPAHLTPARVPA